MWDIFVNVKGSGFETHQMIIFHSFTLLYFFIAKTFGRPTIMLFQFIFYFSSILIFHPTLRCGDVSLLLTYSVVCLLLL